VRLSERTMARLKKKAGSKTVSTWVRELLEEKA
jgi:predicted DNA-binding protein